MVPAEVVGEVSVGVPVKVAQVTIWILRGEGARTLRRSCQKSEVAVGVSAVLSACVGMVSVEVVGEVSVRVSVKVAQVTN
jgi:hypothetical protein